MSTMQVERKNESARCLVRSCFENNARNIAVEMR